MSARDVVLGRVRAAIADVPEPDGPVDWTYGRATGMPDVVGRFVERVEDYRATVVRCASGDLPSEVVRALGSTGARRVVLPTGTDERLHRAIREAGELSVVVDDGSLTAADLDAIDAVVTTSVVGIAETGTIVLDHGPGQGRRALSLVPDRHVCLVRAGDVVSDVPEAVAALAPAVRAGSPLTWISGPSATSDIELSRVEGVHGPRTLWVVVVDD
ncbi:L-lactate dehydrogenase complex protein LldG [Raineyella antarctica]|uniref:L-lactate dehydrogenase complex protein LldG n=1 Tax=Raineyella antarctica TaxID=1577474 RepID=A0A1G6GX05_9ACTN|nr:lactate utilization protein C [Raineyella antarctica]SDB86509.1 L-lactate dehydrogenase complex protein LldG [Raineyella antarctica]